jgi:hypothetical protein
MEDQDAMLEGLTIPPGMVLEVGGRTFRPSSETTFEQDLYIGSLLKDAGLVKMAAGFDLAKDEISDVAVDIITNAFASGKLFDVIAASMEEIGTPWSIPEAKKNAQFFAQLRKAEEKKKLHGAIVGIILGFFVSGAVSSTTSLSFSEDAPQLDHESSSSPQSHPGAESSGAPSTTATGTSSSEK